MSRRNSYTVQKKLAILAWHRSNGSNIHRTSVEFKVDRKRVREWLQKEKDLQLHDYGPAKKKRRLGSGRKALSEELDEDLFEFFEKEREAGRAVSNKLLSQQALKISQSLQLKDFKATDSYISKWKKRYSITMRKGTTDCQKTPEELQEEVSSFISCVKSLRTKNDYIMYHIGNMDQTMCRFDNPSNRTNNLKGEKSIRITNTGCSKRGFTVALAACASGHKLPAFCILKEPSGRIPPRVWSSLLVPDNVKVTATTNGWMTSEKFTDWVKKVWRPNEDDVRRLLVIDRAPIHVTKDAANALASVDTDLVLVPPGCTRILQPADVSWNKPFKTKIAEQWSDFIRKEEKTKQGNLKKPTRQDVLRWVSQAWNSVSENVIRESFKRCGISNSLDGQENGEYHENLSRAVKPTSAELEDDLIGLLFDDSNEEEDFDGFSDEDD